MNTSSFTTRVLGIGAVGFTLVSGFYVAVAAADLVDSVRYRQSWTSLEAPNKWTHLPLIIFSIFLIIALDAAVWSRLFRRRAALRSFSDSRLSPFIPRSKYAVWGHVPRPGRLPGLSAKRTRREPAQNHPAPYRAPLSADHREDRPASIATQTL